MKHTETPWHVETDEKSGRNWISDNSLDSICDLYFSRGDYPDVRHSDFDNHQANAEFITRACNSHAALVAMLEEICVHGTIAVDFRKIEALLKNATE